MEMNGEVERLTANGMYALQLASETLLITFMERMNVLALHELLATKGGRFGISPRSNFAERLGARVTASFDR